MLKNLAKKVCIKYEHDFYETHKCIDVYIYIYIYIYIYMYVLCTVYCVYM